MKMESMMMTLRIGLIIIEAIMIFILINTSLFNITSSELFKAALIILILDGLIGNIKSILKRKY